MLLNEETTLKEVRNWNWLLSYVELSNMSMITWFNMFLVVIPPHRQTFCGFLICSDFNMQGTSWRSLCIFECEGDWRHHKGWHQSLFQHNYQLHRCYTWHSCSGDPFEPLDNIQPGSVVTFRSYNSIYQEDVIVIMQLMIFCKDCIVTIFDFRRVLNWVVLR